MLYDGCWAVAELEIVATQIIVFQWFTLKKFHATRRVNTKKKIAVISCIQLLGAVLSASKLVHMKSSAHVLLRCQVLFDPREKDEKSTWFL